MAQDAVIQRGLGRRKEARARVRLISDPKVFLVNGKPLEEYIDCPNWRFDVLLPLDVTNTRERFGVKASCDGGGKNGQAGALRLGIARALVATDPALRTVLRANGLLTRDGRAVERKKYGLKKARRRPQYSKR